MRRFACRKFKLTTNADSKLSYTPDADGNVCLPDNKEYVDFVKGLSNDEFEFFKNILLKQELYEEVANMIKIRD